MTVEHYTKMRDKLSGLDEEPVGVDEDLDLEREDPDYDGSQEE